APSARDKTAAIIPAVQDSAVTIDSPADFKPMRIRCARRFNAGLILSEVSSCKSLLQALFRDGEPGYSGRRPLPKTNSLGASGSVARCGTAGSSGALGDGWTVFPTTSAAVSPNNAKRLR